MLFAVEVIAGQWRVLICVKASFWYKASFVAGAKRTIPIHEVFCRQERVCFLKNSLYFQYGIQWHHRHNLWYVDIFIFDNDKMMREIIYGGFPFEWYLISRQRLLSVVSILSPVIQQKHYRRIRSHHFRYSDKRQRERRAFSLSV